MAQDLKYRCQERICFQLNNFVMKKLSLILSLVFLVTIAFSMSAQAQKKKWSPQAKGAVIGTATGATAGAIIHKRNRVVGGVVGGVVGAGAGYGVGKIIDNKNKKEAAEEARIAEANRRAANAERIAAAERNANRRRAVAKADNPASVRAAQPQVVPGTYHALVANNPASMYNEDGRPMANLLSEAYMPNEDYGDRTKPYHTSEYRRKSW
jgi:hypothetical protein